MFNRKIEVETLTAAIFAGKHYFGILSFVLMLSLLMDLYIFYISHVFINLKKIFAKKLSDLGYFFYFCIKIGENVS